MRDIGKSISFAIGALLAIILACVLGGCSDNANAKYDGQTLTGKIVEIDGNNITMQLGELATVDKPSGGIVAYPEERGTSEDFIDVHDTAIEIQEEHEPVFINDTPDEDNKIPDELLDLDAPPSGEVPDAPPTVTAPSMNTFEPNDEDPLTFNFASANIMNEQGDEISVNELESEFVLTFTVSTNMKVSEAQIVIEDAEPFNGGVEFNQGAAAAIIDEDEMIEGAEYTSSSDDENALRVTNGAFVVLDKVSIKKGGGESSSTEAGDFYGMNAAFLATDKAAVSIKSSDIFSKAPNGNAVFSYGEDTCVNIADCKIETMGNNSGALQTTGGAAMNAYNLEAMTHGNSSAAIRSDRGGGIVSINGGKYETHGVGSPAIYSTANISAWNAQLAAYNSEALVVEGKT